VSPAAGGRFDIPPVENAVILPPAENERIFREEIVPELLSGLQPQEKPRVAVFVIGQPGAGKTATSEAMLAQFPPNSAVRIDADVLKTYHPDYSDLLDEDDRTAAVRVSPDGRLWTAKTEAYLIEKRANILIEETVRNPDYFTGPQLTRYRDVGYRVDVGLLAVPEALSRMGIAARYNQQIIDKGTGRLTPTENHDASYRAILTVAKAIDDDRLVDAVAVFRRGNVSLYSNRLTPAGDWQAPAGAATAIAQERGRVWTYPEALRYFDDLHKLVVSEVPLVRAAARDVRALAEPLLPEGAEAMHETAKSMPQTPGLFYGPASWASHDRSNSSARGEIYFPRPNPPIDYDGRYDGR
jgi:hypothetical protein